ncbi:MAG TPA: uL15 family ribosomal protein [Candidatus Sulfotelmatobacter sp.]|nr:uL15 family ribosomal protein [Candidatus Sulfotelmatobacter sp.]
MPTRLKKTRKVRGSRTQGWGRIGQHRKTGSRPYRKANRHKQGWSYVTTYEPDYFGKHGFTSRQSKVRSTNVINISKLDALVMQLPAEQEQTIDLTSLGYVKLLGTGKITKPVTVKVQSASKSAAEKIQNAGGKILTVAEESGE